MNRIALALIKQLVANGGLEPDDILAMVRGLSPNEATAVRAAWLDGMQPAHELFVVYGGKEKP